MGDQDRRTVQSRIGVFFVVLALQLCGCASVPQQDPVPAEDLAWVRAGAGMPVGTIVPEDPASLLHVTDAMRQFALHATRAQVTDGGKTTALATAILAPGGVSLQYDADATLTAEQVFAQHRGNCLSFTMLFVALARSVGLPARFNEVRLPPVWDLGNDSIWLLYKHINARVDMTPPFFELIDVSGESIDSHYQQWALSDDDALAQFYNNRAIELRLQQGYADSLAYQLRALQISPRQGYLWTNLASLYLFSGNLRAARIAISRSLELDASDPLAFETAERVYQRLGNQHLAAYFHARVEEFREQNPYHHYELALAALRKGDNGLADEEIRRAIALNRDDPHFYFLLALVLNRMGENQLADKNLQIAIDLAPDASRERYRNKFERLRRLQTF